MLLFDNTINVVRTLTMLGVLFLGEAQASRTVLFANFHFAQNSRAIRSADVQNLIKQLCHLDGRRIVRLVVAGRSSSDELQVLPLSHARVQAVMRIIESIKIPYDELYVESYGNSWPIAPDTPDGRAQNRRVEVEMYYKYDIDRDGKTQTTNCPGT